MRKLLTHQKGAFSPFMYGMLMGVAVFSTVMAQWAKKDLERLENSRQTREEAALKDLQKAYETAILTENVNSRGYSEDVTLDRARQFLSSSTGTTRSGEDVIAQSGDMRGKEAFGIERQRVLLSTTDDEFTRKEMQYTRDAEQFADVAAKEEAPTAFFDTGDARAQQIKKSVEYLDMEAAQVYLFYSNQRIHPDEYRLPLSHDEYKDHINAYTNLADVWGQEFTYTPNKADPENKGALSFTTPWGYTHSIPINMK